MVGCRAASDSCAGIPSLKRIWSRVRLRSRVRVRRRILKTGNSITFIQNAKSSSYSNCRVHSRQLIILAETRRRADIYINSKDVINRMRAFECSSALDPTFCWSVSKRWPNFTEALVTQDWFLEEEQGISSGTVQENVEYTEQCWKKPCWASSGHSIKMFHTEESRFRLSAGETFVLNAAVAFECGVISKALKDRYRTTFTLPHSICGYG